MAVPARKHSCTSGYEFTSAGWPQSCCSGLPSLPGRSSSGRSRVQVVAEQSCDRCRTPANAEPLKRQGSHPSPPVRDPRGRVRGSPRTRARPRGRSSAFLSRCPRGRGGRRAPVGGGTGRHPGSGCRSSCRGGPAPGSSRAGPPDQALQRAGTAGTAPMTGDRPAEPLGHPSAGPQPACPARAAGERIHEQVVPVGAPGRRCRPTATGTTPSTWSTRAHVACWVAPLGARRGRADSRGHRRHGG